mmetsp:Transcript_79079/g.156636  ORF Transcript_79079/g.156636 Transcript_79079/m.156636 type:complete len:133 (+) Transcript_79079:1652-2050(+)
MLHLPPSPKKSTALQPSFAMHTLLQDSKEPSPGMLIILKGGLSSAHVSQAALASFTIQTGRLSTPYKTSHSTKQARMISFRNQEQASRAQKSSAHFLVRGMHLDQQPGLDQKLVFRLLDMVCLGAGPSASGW